MKKLWIAAALSLPVVLPIAYAAFLSPAIEFLRPSPTATWIVHPDPRARGFFARDFRSADVEFIRTFVLDAPPSSFEIHVTALDRFTVRINSQAPRLEGAGNWKRGLDLDLAPYVRGGENQLVIRVSYPEGLPALLVEGRGAAREWVASDRRWRARHAGGVSAPVPAARALRDEVFLDGRENPLGTAPHPWWRLLLFGLVAFIGYAVVPVRFKPWLRAPRAAPAPPTFVAEHGVSITVFAIVAVAQLHNAATFGSMYGMPDTPAHVEYVRHVAEHWRAPLAEEGWQMYHPPLFYFVAAALRTALSNVSAWFASVTFLQVLNTVFGLANLVFAWLLLRRLLPQRTLAHNLGFSLVAMLPMAFYMNPNVTNEVFAASMVGCTLFASSALLFDGELTSRRALLLGALCGLALLSKFTGLFVMASILALLALRAAAAGSGPQRRRIGMFGVGLGTTALVIAGWFYVRNWLHYGDPFLGNWDYASGFHYEQIPGYRTAGFYTRFGALLWHLPEWSRWSSFWEGLYGTLWTDAHGFFLPGNDPRAELLGSLTLWLALLPTLGIALGFLRACRLLFSNGWDHPFFILVTTSFWTLGAVALFSMEVPFYSTISAFFALSLVPAIGVFAGLGLELLCRQLGRLRVLLYGDLLGLYALILYLFSFG